MYVRDDSHHIILKQDTQREHELETYTHHMRNLLLLIKGLTYRFFNHRTS